MKMTWKPNALLEAGAGGSGGGGGTGGISGSAPFDIATMAPEDIRGEPSLAAIKTVQDLAKGYVHAQKMVGADKILKPQKNWTDVQWNDWFNNVGRPKSAEEYTFKVENPPEGVTVDEAKLKEAKSFLHKQGLTDAQASGILKFYLDTIGTQSKSLKDAEDANRTKSIAELKQEFGNNYEAKVNIAKAVLTKFGTPELVEEVINKTGLGDNPAFIRMFSKIGEAMMDDSARGTGSGMLVTDATKALAEIKTLKGDQNFLKTFLDRSAPGHKEAVERMEHLHKIANPEDRSG